MNTPELSYNTRRYRALRAMGRCVHCGKPSLEKTRCEYCAKKQSAASMASNKRRVVREREELKRLRARVAELEFGGK